MIRVASYNIHKSVGMDRKRRPGRILDVLNEINADIVALQEVDRRTGPRATTLPRRMIEQETDLKIVEVAIRPDSIGWHGNALLVRKDAEVLEAKRHEIPFFEPRGAISAALRLPAKTLRVVGTHLSLLRSFRRQQIRAIDAQFDNGPMPTLIMGDLNEWRLEGALDALGPDYKVEVPGASFPANRPKARLDRLILHNDLELLRGAVHTSPLAMVASDHLPIWADIRA